MYNIYHRFVRLDQSSDQLPVEHLLEYFDKRFEGVAQNMERLISDVATIRNQIDELIPDVNHLKHRMADIDKTNKNEHNDNVAANLFVPQTKQ